MVNPLNSHRPSEIADQAPSARRPAAAHAPQSQTSSVRNRISSEQVRLSTKSQIAATVSQAARQSNGVDPLKVQAIREQMHTRGGAPTAPLDHIAEALINSLASE